MECLKIADTEEREKIMKYLRENDGRSKRLTADTATKMKQENRTVPQVIPLHEQATMETESDTEFEFELQRFRERLEKIEKQAIGVKSSKLVPNISRSWIKML